jgi:3-keto-L-gulonate-6-phosphate decarboxylase
MKIVDRGKEAVALGLQGGADWITVLAGTGTSVIRVATIAAHNAGKKVMLDLIDAHSPEQSALDAVSLGVDALLFHRPSDEENRHLSFLERWDMIRGNTKIPLYIAAPHGAAQINTVIELNPDGVVLSSVAAQQRSILATVLEIRQLMDEQKSQR